MTVWDWVRVLALAGMAWGAWVNFRKRPRGLRYEGKLYYPLPDGRFCSRWGLIVTDPALTEALAARVAGTEAKAPPSPEG